MHIFEILMIVPFTNTIVQHLFSQMNRVKIDYQDLDWICVCMLEKKGLAPKISRLIVLSIVGGQRRKDVPSHIHIIILQKSVFV